jgi:hypothetical protein
MDFSNVNHVPSLILQVLVVNLLGGVVLMALDHAYCWMSRIGVRLICVRHGALVGGELMMHVVPCFRCCSRWYAK